MALKRIELQNPKGCLSLAADDEPIFVLRANDELAPAVIDIWVDRYIHTKKRDGQWTERRGEKAREARKLAQQMRDWKKAQREKEHGG